MKNKDIEVKDQHNILLDNIDHVYFVPAINITFKTLYKFVGIKITSCLQTGQFPCETVFTTSLIYP